MSLNYGEQTSMAIAFIVIFILKYLMLISVALHNLSMIYAMIPCSLILKSLILATNRNIRYVIP